MAKHTMMKLFYSGGMEAAEQIAKDLQAASRLWVELSSPDTPEAYTALINENLQRFRELNHTGTWEDAMVWAKLLNCYDAQHGLSCENGMYAQQFLDALKASEASAYAKKTAVSAYDTLR